METKQDIEKRIAKLFLERKLGIRVNDDDLMSGDHIKHEPDILYANMGIEVGAVLSGVNIQIDQYVIEFLSKVSQAVAGRMPEYLQIRLVMQDDRDTVNHTPTSFFQAYKYLPKYLDGIFVVRLDEGRVSGPVVLNQKPGMRCQVFPNIMKNKEFLGFVDELVRYVNSLKPSEFIESWGTHWHHRVVNDGKLKANPKNPLEDFINENIIAKLRENKYTGEYEFQILLLHNYLIGEAGIINTDIRFYSHHRNDIFNLLWKYINNFGSFKTYAGIYFLDFSSYLTNTEFDLVNFKEYSPQEPSKFLAGYDEIRIEP